MQAIPQETPHSNAMTPAGRASERKATGAAEPIFPPVAAEFHPVRVLVVDDEALLRWSLREMLVAAGCEVVEARDGREARRAFGDVAQPLDAILLDLKLPDAYGLELIQEARRGCLTCPIIVMTAYGTSDTVEAAIQAGALRVFSKPFDLEDVVRLVCEACPRPPH
jgi:DNA-binding NtrC family response regulator